MLLEVGAFSEHLGRRSALIYSVVDSDALAACTRYRRVRRGLTAQCDFYALSIVINWNLKNLQGQVRMLKAFVFVV